MTGIDRSKWDTHHDKREADVAVTALRRIAQMDCRGNEPEGSRIAREALQQLEDALPSCTEAAIGRVRELCNIADGYRTFAGIVSTTDVRRALNNTGETPWES